MEKEQLNLLELNDKLCSVVIHGKVNAVENLIKQGANINFNEGEVLATAVFSKNIEVIKYLVLNGANIYENKCKLLIKAVRDGELEVFKALTSNGIDFKNNSSKELKDLIIFAASSGHLEIIRYLLEIGADIKTPNLLNQACQFGDLDIVKFIMSSNGGDNEIDNPYKERALFIAVKGNQLEIVKYLLENGAKVNHSGNVINEAVEISSFEMAKYLFSKGAIVDTSRDSEFFYAIEDGEIDIIKFFVVDCKVSIDKVLSYAEENEVVRSWAMKYKSSKELNDKLQTELIVNKIDRHKIKI